MNYKLHKIYPGSPDLGYISKPKEQAAGGGFDHYWSGTWFDPGNYPEFWMEIVEKNYEILSYIGKSTKNVLSATIDPFVLNDLIAWNDKNLNIYTVKRLSDGEIFTVGDKIKGDIVKSLTIEKFTICNDSILIWTRIDKGLQSCKHILDCKKVKTSLFTTEDRINYYDGDDLVWDTHDFNSNNPEIRSNPNFLEQTPVKYAKNIPTRKFFSLKENAEKYITENKPQYSKKDVISAIMDCPTTIFQESSVRDWVNNWNNKK